MNPETCFAFAAVFPVFLFGVSLSARLVHVAIRRAGIGRLMTASVVAAAMLGTVASMIAGAAGGASTAVAVVIWLLFSTTIVTSVVFSIAVLATDEAELEPRLDKMPC